MDGVLTDPENVPDPLIYRAWFCWPGGGRGGGGGEGCSRVVSGSSRERERHRKRKLAKSDLPSLQRASVA